MSARLAAAAALALAVLAGCAAPADPVRQFHNEWVELSSFGQAGYCQWTVNDAPAFIAQAQTRTGATEENDWAGLAEYMDAVQTACAPFYRD